MTPFAVAGHHLDLSRIVCIGDFKYAFGMSSSRCDVTFSAFETTIHGLTREEYGALVQAWSNQAAESTNE